MPPRRRLDAELVRRGMVTSRAEAHRLIAVGGVTVGGRPAPRPATLVAPDDPITMAATAGWASRGGQKLAAALESFPIEVTGRRALDVGASTGGFTDVLLAAGAEQVVAVDVGYGQLLWRLRTDPRVVVHDRTNFRNADVFGLGAPFGVVVVDVSFISVRLLADRLAAAGEAGTDYVILVKPQFEAGRDAIGSGGIVRDPATQEGAVLAVAAGLSAVTIGPLRAMRSPILGAKGNVEFLLHGRLGEAAAADSLLLAGCRE